MSREPILRAVHRYTAAQHDVTVVTRTVAAIAWPWRIIMAHQVNGYYSAH